MRKQGVEVTYETKLNEFVFLGDTTHHVFELEPNILNYKTVICECTFLTEDDLSHAEEKKHMNWINLRPIIKSNPEVTFVLTHFSRKYKKEFVDEFFHTEFTVLVLQKVDQIGWQEVSQLTETTRGAGGFGSTGLRN